MRRLLLYLLLIVIQTTAWSATSTPTAQLLARLRLDDPALKKVKSAKNERQAAAELLNYFKARTTVKHLINPKDRNKYYGKAASEADLKRADDALRHVFVGQPSYPPHFCGDDIDWSTSPVPDKEWVWQLNRMTFWNSMALAYWHTGDERYAKEWSFQLTDWVKKNPRDEAHAYAWRSIEAGIRGHSWIGLYERFLHSPSFTPEVLVIFLNSCFDHADYLMTKYTKRSNWGLMEAEGMAFIALTFPEFRDSDKWLQEASVRLNTELNAQVYEDGHQRELAFSYHIGCIDWFMRTFTYANQNGKGSYFSDNYTAIVEKMCEVPLKLAFPNGQTPQFGDSWIGKPGQHYNRLKQWSTYFNRPDFLYVATEGKEGTPPKATAFALPISGLYSMRSGWDKEAICLVLKCGPDGGGHSQPDNGTFELFAGGRNLMPDAGSYIYSGNPEGRAWFRQTAVHQTLTLDSANSAYAPKLVHWENKEDVDILVVENASYQNLTHRRAVFFVDKKYFVIVDDALGEATGNVDIHFQLAPGEALFDYQKNVVRSDYKDSWNVMVQSQAKQPLVLTPEKGEVSFVYTQKESRPAFRFRQVKKNNNDPIQFVTIVAPYEKTAPTIQCSIQKDTTEELVLKVTYQGESRLIGYSKK